MPRPPSPRRPRRANFVEPLEGRLFLAAHIAVTSISSFEPVVDGQTLAAATALGFASDFDYGYTAFGQPPYVRNFTFTLTNDGDEPLNVKGVSLPTGFKFASPFAAAVLQPNDTLDIVPAVDTTKIGSHQGFVGIASDLSATPFRFEIRATVFGGGADKEWGAVSNSTIADVVSFAKAVDSNGGVVYAPGTRLTGLTLPAGRNQFTFKLDAKTSEEDLSFKLFADATGVGLLSLAERATPLVSMTTRGSKNSAGPKATAQAAPATLPGGHYFIEMQITSIDASGLDGSAGSGSSLTSDNPYGIQLTTAPLPDPNVAVTVSGAGVGSTAVPSTGTVDLGSVALNAAGTAATRTFTVRNAGPGALTVTSLKLSANSGFTNGGLSGKIASGASKTFTATMVTSTAGDKAATIEIKSDDPDTPTYTILLKGKVNGAPPPNVRPTIDALTLAVDSTGKYLVLRVPTPADTDGTVARVEFFKDDGDGVFDPAKDKLVGSDTSAKKGWKFALSLSTLAKKKTLRFFARAVDNLGAKSKARAATIKLT